MEQVTKKAPAPKKAALTAPKRRGRPAGVKNLTASVNWQALAKKLDRELKEQIKDNKGLEWQIEFYRGAWTSLRELSFFERVFKWPK